MQKPKDELGSGIATAMTALMVLSVVTLVLWNWGRTWLWVDADADEGPVVGRIVFADGIWRWGMPLVAIIISCQLGIISYYLKRLINKD